MVQEEVAVLAIMPELMLAMELLAVAGLKERRIDQCCG